jgi:photosystem II stability/assembly factor-like uncharacterized protein
MMRTYLIPLFLLTALAIAAHAGIDDWANVGPVGGAFSLLAIDPQNPGIIYAGTDVGVFKSTDGGASWNNAGLNGFPVSALIIDPEQPTIIYAVTTLRPDGGPPAVLWSTAGVFKSTDGGGSWNALPVCCPLKLAIDPQNTGTLYALDAVLRVGSGAVVVSRSTDAGASWSKIYELSSDVYTFFNYITVDPKTPGTLYVAMQDLAVFKSVDGGASWSEADAGLRGAGSRSFADGGLTIDSTTPATMYASTSGGGVYKTTDGAASWHAVNSGLPIGTGAGACCSSAVVIDPGDSNTLYVPNRDGALFKSTDGGASWNASGLIPGVRSLTIDPRNSSSIYAATGSGVYKSTDAGISFAPYSQARAIPVRSLALDPQSSGAIFAAGFLDGAFKSTDAGMTWLRYTDTGVALLAIDPGNPSILYSGNGDDECNYASISNSVDGGTSWVENWRSAYHCLWTIVIDPQTPGTVYAGSTDYGVVKTTDGGSTWNIMSSGLPGTPHMGPGPPAVTALAISPRNTSTLFAGLVGAELYDYGTGNYAAGIFKSTDGGANWVGASTGIPAYRYEQFVNTLEVDPQTPSTVYAAMSLYNAAGGLWKSIDGGAHWRNVFPVNAYAIAINPQSPSTIYAGVDNGLARSTDGGENWTVMPPGPGLVSVLALDPQDPNTVYTGGPGGIFAIRFAPVLPDSRGHR